jgi:hypothetical protein
MRWCVTLENFRCESRGKNFVTKITRQKKLFPIAEKRVKNFESHFFLLSVICHNVFIVKNKYFDLRQKYCFRDCIGIEEFLLMFIDCSNSQKWGQFVSCVTRIFRILPYLKKMENNLMSIRMCKFCAPTVKRSQQDS